MIEKSTETRRRRLVMSLANRKVVQADHNSRNQRGIHHHLLLHLHPEIEASIAVTIHSTSRLDRPNLRVVCHKEVVEVLHVVDVLESILENVVMSRRVVSSVVKKVTS